VGSQPLDGQRELSHSSYVRRPSWYGMKLMDSQEQEEAPRSIDRESRPPNKCPYFRAPMSSVIDSNTSSVQGETNQQGWRDANVQDVVCNIVSRLKVEPIPGESSRNTFLAKREC